MERVGSLKRDKRTGEKIDGDKSRKRTGSGSSHSSLVGFEAKYPVSYTRKEGGASMREVWSVVCVLASVPCEGGEVYCYCSVYWRLRVCAADLQLIDCGRP